MARSPIWAVAAVILAGGCGPAASAPRQPPASPPAAPVSGEEAACRDLLGTGGQVERRPALTLNPGVPRLVCIAEMTSAGETELVIVLLGRDGDGWSELARESAPMGEQSTEEVTETEGAQVAPIAIAPTEKALQLTRAKSREGPQFSDTSTTVSILRITGDTLDEVFKVSSETSAGEADKRDVATFEVTDELTAGFFDILVTRERSSAQWAAGEGLVEEEPEAIRHVWNGTRYVEAGSMN